MLPTKGTKLPPGPKMLDFGIEPGRQEPEPIWLKVRMLEGARIGAWNFAPPALGKMVIGPPLIFPIRSPTRAWACSRSACFFLSSPPAQPERDKTAISAAWLFFMVAAFYETGDPQDNRSMFPDF